MLFRSDLVRKIEQTKMLDQLAKLNKPTGTAQKLQVIQGGAAPSSGAAGADAGGGPSARSKTGALDPWTSMKLRIHKALIDVVDMKKMNADMNDPKQRDPVPSSLKARACAEMVVEILFKLSISSAVELSTVNRAVLGSNPRYSPKVDWGMMASVT